MPDARPAAHHHTILLFSVVPRSATCPMHGVLLTREDESSRGRLPRPGADEPLRVGRG